MADFETLRRRIREHHAFQGGEADEGYWLDFLECQSASKIDPHRRAILTPIGVQY